LLLTRPVLPGLTGKGDDVYPPTPILLKGRSLKTKWVHAEVTEGDMTRCIHTSRSTIMILALIPDHPDMALPITIPQHTLHMAVAGQGGGDNTHPQVNIRHHGILTLAATGRQMVPEVTTTPDRLALPPITLL
jgi:hypothetical protein